MHLRGGEVTEMCRPCILPLNFDAQHMLLGYALLDNQGLLSICERARKAGLCVLQSKSLSAPLSVELSIIENKPESRRKVLFPTNCSQHEDSQRGTVLRNVPHPGIYCRVEGLNCRTPKLRGHGSCQLTGTCAREVETPSGGSAGLAFSFPHFILA